MRPAPSSRTSRRSCECLCGTLGVERDVRHAPAARPCEQLRAHDLGSTSPAALVRCGIAEQLRNVPSKTGAPAARRAPAWPPAGTARGRASRQARRAPSHRGNRCQYRLAPGEIETRCGLVKQQVRRAHPSTPASAARRASPPESVNGDRAPNPASGSATLASAARSHSASGNRDSVARRERRRGRSRQRTGSPGSGRRADLPGRSGAGPSTDTLPAAGRSRPASSRKSVDLPEPVAPRPAAARPARPPARRRRAQAPQTRSRLRT